MPPNPLILVPSQATLLHSLSHWQVGILRLPPLRRQSRPGTRSQSQAQASLSLARWVGDRDRDVYFKFHSAWGAWGRCDIQVATVTVTGLTHWQAARSTTQNPSPW